MADSMTTAAKDPAMPRLNLFFILFTIVFSYLSSYSPVSRYLLDAAQSAMITTPLIKPNIKLITKPATTICPSSLLQKEKGLSTFG